MKLNSRSANAARRGQIKPRSSRYESKLFRVYNEATPRRASRHGPQFLFNRSGALKVPCVARKIKAAIMEGAKGKGGRGKRREKKERKREGKGEEKVRENAARDAAITRFRYCEIARVPLASVSPSPPRFFSSFPAGVRQMSSRNGI